MKTTKLNELSTYYQTFLDYERNESNCGGGRNCENYCHCTTLSPEITNIDLNYIYKDIIGHSSIETILDYGVDRLVQSITMNDFDAHGVSGYYGEELEITLEESGKDKLNTIYSLENLSDIEIIYKCLEKEYGFVLETLKNKKIKVLDIDLKDIILPSDQYKKVNQEVVANYRNRDEIWLLVKEIGTKYSLIDGYHRYSSAQQTNKKTVKVIVFYD